MEITVTKLHYFTLVVQTISFGLRQNHREKRRIMEIEFESFIKVLLILQCKC